MNQCDRVAYETNVLHSSCRYADRTHFFGLKSADFGGLTQEQTGIEFRTLHLRVFTPEELLRFLHSLNTCCEPFHMPHSSPFNLVMCADF